MRPPSLAGSNVRLLAAVMDVAQLMRAPSSGAAQKRQIIAWEDGQALAHLGRTDENLPQHRAGLPFQVPPSMERVRDLVAHRIGIARQSFEHREPTDPAVARISSQHGCLAVLRAKL